MVKTEADCERMLASVQRRMAKGEGDLTPEEQAPAAFFEGPAGLLI